MSTSPNKESIYKQCSAAIDRLLEHPPRLHGGFFTEIDVIAEAATENWGKADYDKAMHEANEICGKRYRDRKLCRYGPVKIGKGEGKIEDYARIAGKIVYADAVNGPTLWKTPNGEFKKLTEEADTLTRQGRKSAANRNDAEPWDQQVLPASRSRKARRTTNGRAKDADLMELVIDLSKRVKSLEEDKNRRDEFHRKQVANAA